VKVGDLVREVFTCGEHSGPLFGPGVALHSDALTDRNGSVELWWRVLFGSELNYVREADLEVINASR
jgi:hypothetical protein